MIIEQQRRKSSYTALILIATVVGFGRWFLEANLGVAKLNGVLPFAYALYYLAVGMSFHLILYRMSGISRRHSLNLARLGLLVGLLPPIVDLANFWLQAVPLLPYSYYLYETFAYFSPSFYSPRFGFPLGEAVAVWLIILLSFFFTIRETRNPLRIIAATAAAYGVFLFFLVLLPKGLTDYFTQGDAGLNLDAAMQLSSRNGSTRYHVFVHFALIVIFSLMADANFRKALVKRVFHYLPFGAIAMAPFIFTANYGLLTLCVPALVMLNFLFACMQNDLYDSKTAKTGLPNSNQQGDSVRYFMILMFLLVGYLYGIGSLLFFPQLIFLILTLLYNLPETRMRYYTLGGQKIEGGWGVCALWSGLVCLKISPFQVSTVVLTVLVFFGWAYLSSIKDLKDILSDRRDGRRTLISFLQIKFGNLSTGVRFYKIQIALIVILPTLFLLARKTALETLLFTGCFVLPIWAILYWAPRLRLFSYFSAAISAYFVAFAYTAGY